jgi:hypothetical protein
MLHFNPTKDHYSSRFCENLYSIDIRRQTPYQNPSQSLRPLFSLRSALDPVGSDLLYLKRPGNRDLRGFS